MRPDKQSEYDHVPGIYRELSRELRLPEQRIREMEQKIRQKAAEKETPSVVVYSGGKARRTVRRLAYALAPVAACAVVALTCVIAYKTGMLKPSEYQTAESEPEFAEQTGVYLQTGLTTDANEQTDTVTEAVTVYTPVSGTGAGTLTAVPDVTEAPQDAGQTAPAETEQQETAAQPAATEPVTYTEPAVTTADVDPNAPPVVVVQETLPPPQFELPETPDSAVVAVDDTKAHPGGDVTVVLSFRQDTELAGFQFFIRVKTLSDAALPEITEYSFPIMHDSAVRISPTCNCNLEEKFLSVTFADAALKTIPAGTELARITLHIPEDVDPGTSYELDGSTGKQEQKIVALAKEDDITDQKAFYFGKIYIE